MKRIIRKYIGLSVISAALIIAVSGGHAYAENETVDERLEAIDQKVKVLERKWELDKEAASAKAKEAAFVGAGKDGFFLRSADSGYQLKIGGYIQADGRSYIDDNGAKGTDTFLLRRVYLNIDGTISKDFDFRISPDFGQGKAVLQDAYVGYKYSPEARVRIGRFKAPFSLEYLQSSTDPVFIESSLSANLVPNRELGIQLHGDLLGGTVNYAVGLFNGVQDGASSDGDSNDGKDVTGRIFIHPFKKSGVESLEGLGIGAAASQGDRPGNSTTTLLPSYKTLGQLTFFSYKTGTAWSGDSSRFSPQGYYYLGSLGVTGEYVSSAQQISNGTIVEKIENNAWQTTVSYVLTGEKSSYKGVKPIGPHGAFEVVGRYSELNVDKDAFINLADPAKSARSAKETGIGFNWYVDSNIKVSADYEVTKFKGGASGGIDRDDEKVFLSRVQAVF